MSIATVTKVLSLPKRSSYGWLIKVEYRLDTKIRQGEISTLTIEEARSIKAGYQIQAA